MAPPETGSRARARPAVGPAPSLADGPGVCTPWRLRRDTAAGLKDWRRGRARPQSEVSNALF